MIKIANDNISESHTGIKAYLKQIKTDLSDHMPVFTRYYATVQKRARRYTVIKVI